MKLDMTVQAPHPFEPAWRQIQLFQGARLGLAYEAPRQVGEGIYRKRPHEKPDDSAFKGAFQCPPVLT